MSQTAVDGGSLMVPCRLEWSQTVSGVLVPAATDNQPFRISGASLRDF